jgi:hypothetical protein
VEVYHPKHIEQFPDINKQCNIASCWIYIGILLGFFPILYISRIRVKIAPTCFGTVTPASGSALFVLAEVTFVTVVNYGTSVCG